MNTPRKKIYMDYLNKYVNRVSSVRKKSLVFTM